ncbi:MAG: Shikimate dehydrogenase [Planctomycetota bacterium]
MICVSIGRGRHREMIAEHKYLAEQGVGLIELRVDWIMRPVNLQRLFAERPCPAIFTCRRENDGGKWTKPESERQILLRSAIASGVDYIDLEEDIAASIPRYGKTKRIISYHNFRETPANLEEIHRRMATLDADIVKLATMAHSQHDNLRMMRLVKSAKIPTVGLCMGEVGMPSRVLCLKFGSPFSFAAFHADRSLAPGQLSFKDMLELYRAHKINADTEVYGVVADPVAHSMSPRIHNTGFGQLGLNKVYVPFRVGREELPTFLANCREFGVKGLSVTIPHKEEALRLLSRTDEASEHIGAVNTIDLSGPTAIGANTDCDAAMSAILRVFGRDGVDKTAATTADNSADNSADKSANKAAATESAPLAHVRALILGAGGAARAVVYGLRKAGAACVIANRTPERAAELARRFACETASWEDRGRERYDLVVNCTPIGMHPKVDETPLEARSFGPRTVVFDTIYNPEQTLLVKHAREAGCQVITGVDMFVAQAARQFEIFTGQTPPVQAMRDQVMRSISAARS